MIRSVDGVGGGDELHFVCSLKFIFLSHFSNKHYFCLLLLWFWSYIFVVLLYKMLQFNIFIMVLCIKLAEWLLDNKSAKMDVLLRLEVIIHFEISFCSCLIIIKSRILLWRWNIAVNEFFVFQSFWKYYLETRMNKFKWDEIIIQQKIRLLVFHWKCGIKIWCWVFF